MVKRAYQITVICSDFNMPVRKQFQQYYLDYIEPQNEEENAELEKFIIAATNAFVQNYCIKNNCPKDKIITRFEKVCFANFDGKEIKP